MRKTFKVKSLFKATLVLAAVFLFAFWGGKVYAAVVSCVDGNCIGGQACQTGETYAGTCSNGGICCIRTADDSAVKRCTNQGGACKATCDTGETSVGACGNSATKCCKDGSSTGTGTGTGGSYPGQGGGTTAKGGTANLQNEISKLGTSYGMPGGSIVRIIYNILSWMLVIFGFIGIGGFVISGIQYLISAGDEDMIDRSKLHMKWSIVGVVVGLMGFVVLQAVTVALTGYSWFF
ncbi:MAG: hypothetical protein NTZ97_00730 [Candidatus Moranbacteria bacterium]|nr:hypothetical protein [Candidatus Moranbacteria bacterium]